MKFWVAMATILENRKTRREKTPAREGWRRLREDWTKLKLRRKKSTDLTSHPRKAFPKDRQEEYLQGEKESTEEFSWVEITFEENHHLANDSSSTLVSDGGEDIFLGRLSVLTDLR